MRMRWQTVFACSRSTWGSQGRSIRSVGWRGCRFGKSNAAPCLPKVATSSGGFRPALKAIHLSLAFFAGFQSGRNQGTAQMLLPTASRRPRTA